MQLQEWGDDRMRIRSIKPEFWRSLDTARYDYFTRLLFIGLWSYVDDNGVGNDSVDLIRADLFPLDAGDSELSRRIHGGLTELSNGGQIVRYEGPDKRRYLYVRKWKEHQRINRPTTSKKPLPTSTDTEAHDTLTEPSRSPHDTFTEGSLPEQGSKGTREQGIEGASKPRERGGYSPEFETFWSTYPRKEAKRQAWKAWGKAIERATPEQITAGARRYADDPNRSDQFTKHGSTWLNADGWEDEPLPAQSPSSASSPTWVDIARAAAQQPDYIDGEVIELRELG